MQYKVKRGFDLIYSFCCLDLFLQATPATVLLGLMFDARTTSPMELVWTGTVQC